MSFQSHSKSGLFMIELLINLLLFCLLCGCGLMFFIKSFNLTTDATALHHAVGITTSVAGIYETGDGSFAPLLEMYPDAAWEDKYLCIYLNEYYSPCTKDETAFYIMAEQLDNTVDKIRIDFYNSNGEVLYSIPACHYTPATLGVTKEVAVP